MSIQIALVEDEAEAAARLSSYFERYGKDHNTVFQISRYESGDQFIARYQPIYDVVFMDIMMPGSNGMDTARELRKMDENVTLVFVTNMAQFAVKGYEVEAFDFIVKPVTYVNFELKLNRIMGKLENIQRNNYLLLNLPEGKKRISPAQIRYVEVVGHKVTYHTAEDNYTVYGSMKAVEEQMNPKVFSRCNNCFLINLNFVTAVGANSATVGNEELQISRSRRKAFVEQLNAFLGGNF